MEKDKRQRNEVGETGKITLIKAFLHHMPSFHLPSPSSYRQEPDDGYDSDLIDPIKNREE